MKKAFLYSMLLCSAVVPSLYANTQQCPTNIQLTHYEPASCYYNYSQFSCTDVCSTADPEYQGACFREIDLPCYIQSELFSDAVGYQERGRFRWVHIFDLLGFDELLTDYYIFQDEMHRTLYEKYLVKPPLYSVFSHASQKVKIENFRLNILNKTRSITKPLNDAGLFRRLSLGKVLDIETEYELDRLHELVNSFDLLNVTGKVRLSREIEVISNSQLLYWNYIKSADETLVATSRVSHLNTLLDQLVRSLNELSKDKRIHLYNKASVLFEPYDMNLYLCGLATFSVCAEPIGGNIYPHFYQGDDQLLTYFEEILFLLLKETEAFNLSYDSSFTPGQKGSFSAPDFSGFINDKLVAYSNSPTGDALTRLELAINLAFLQLGHTGLNVFEALKITAESEIEGMVFLAPFNNKKPLLCHDYERLDPLLADLKDMIFEKSKRFDQIIIEASSSGHTPALLTEILLIMSDIDALVLKSKSLSYIERFDYDREINVLWKLNDDNENFSNTTKRIDIEFIAIDGIFWTHNMGSGLHGNSSIVELSTMKGSLLPSGTGKLSGMESLRLTLRQSLYTNCASSDNEVKVIIAVTDEDGLKSRHVLTAIINKF